MLTSNKTLHDIQEAADNNKARPELCALLILQGVEFDNKMSREELLELWKKHNS